MSCIGSPSAPSPTATGQDYLSLVNAFSAGQGTLYGTEKAYKPSFINLALRGTNQALNGYGQIPGLLDQTAGAAGTAADLNTYGRASNVADVQTLGPAAAGAVRSLNPGGSALYDQLTQTASSQLAAGTQIDPATATRVTQGVRSDWARRGLGDSAPGQLDEALQLAGSGQSLLAQREGAASDAINTGNSFTAPALALATNNAGIPGMATDLVGAGSAFGSGAGSTLIPAGQSYDIFNTAYNARAAADIAGQNNQAAVLGSMLSY